MNEYGKRVAKKMEDYMGDPNSVSKEINDIQNAIEGVEVRGALAAGVAKSFNKSKNAEEKAEEAHEITQDLLDETFDSAALEANFEQRLDEAIENLQPEWTEFKNDVTTQLAETKQELNQKLQLVDESLNFTIGDDGDFSTLNEALKKVSRMKTTHAGGGISIELKYLSGYVVKEQTSIENIDLSYVTLTSEDEEVQVDITGNIIRALNSKLPNIKVLFNMNHKGSTGLHLERGSSVFVHRDCGVKNAGLHGIHFIESNGTILETIFTGAVGCGVRLTQASTVTAMGADASHAGLDGFYVTRASSLHANETTERKTKATNCGDCGVRISNSMGAFRKAVLTGNANRGILVTSGGIIQADSGADCSNSGVDGVLADSGGVAVVPKVIANNCGEKGLHARYGGKIYAEEGTANGNVDGVYARHGSEVVFDRGKALDNTQRAVWIRDASKISGLGIEAKTTGESLAVTLSAGSTGSFQGAVMHGITLERSSSANLELADCRRIDELGGSDISVQKGSTVSAFNSTGSLSQEPNIITPNGIIFKEEV